MNMDGPILTLYNGTGKSPSYVSYPFANSAACLALLGVNCDGRMEDPYSGTVMIRDMVKFELWSFGNNSSAASGTFRLTLMLYGYQSTPTPTATGTVVTPTATPTGSPMWSTPIPNATLACITATVRGTATPQATPTIFGPPAATATGGASPTPTSTGWIFSSPTPNGGTPMPTATPVVGDVFESDVAVFRDSLAPWTAASGWTTDTTDAYWSSEVGADGLTGTARLSYNTFSLTASSYAVPVGSIVFIRIAGLPLPLRVVADVQSDPAKTGWENRLVLYVKSGSIWTRADSVVLSQNWQTKVQLQALSGTVTSTVTALALQLVACNTTNLGCVNADEYYYSGFQGRALLDNVRIAAGEWAVQRSYPVCPNTGGQTTKQCWVKITTIEAGSCPTPANVLDLGGWVAWVWCRISTYFAWLQTNNLQFTNLIDRQYAQEPFGSMVDIVNSIQQFQQMAEDLAALNQQSQNTAPNWQAMLDTGVLTTPPNIYIPDVNAFDMSQCPSSLSNLTDYLARGVCFVVVNVRNTFFIQVLQWGLNVVSVFGLVALVRRVRGGNANL